MTGSAARVARNVLLVAVPFIVGIALGALFLGDFGESDDGPTGGTGGLPQINLGKAGTYLAIGDSYSAGEGLPDYEQGTQDLPAGDRCHRSPQYAFPLRLQSAFAFDTMIVHRACSGAEIQHVFSTVQEHSGTKNHLGLQIEPDRPGVPGTISDDLLLVTITMSGNDLHFADMLIFCATHSSCLDDEFQHTGLSLSEWAERGLDSIGKRLTELYETLRASVPADTRVLAVGYPGLFPEKIPSLLSNAFCHEILKVWGDPERAAIRDWNVRLNGKVHAAADVAGIEYVDVFPFFSQHETCGPAGPWIKFIGDPSHEERDGWFHPTRVGQYMMARVVACYLHVYRSYDEARAQDDADAIEMGNCVANVYPTVSSTSLPTPCVELQACAIEEELG